jgi:hypothetical protein
MTEKIYAQVKKDNPDLPHDDVDQLTHIEFETKYAQLIEKIIIKAEFLLQLNIPG